MSKQSGPSEHRVAHAVACRVHWYTMSKQSGPSEHRVAHAVACRVHWYTMSKQSGGECGECVQVHYEQTVRAPPNTALPTR